MPRAPRITKLGHCPVCKVKLEPTARVLRTDSGSIVCEAHEHVFVPERIAYRGPYRGAK